jgi:hypothetical protein
MRVILFVIFLLTVILALSQTSGNMICFTGYLYSKDSLPVEDAELINYTTHKIFLTRSDGFFQIFLDERDSLLINHISFERMIIKPNNHPSVSNKYYLTLSTVEIKTVTINYREQINFENNIKNIKTEMRKSTPAYTTNNDRNSYAPSRNDNVAGIDVIKLYQWIKTQQFKKGKKK